MAEVQMQRIRLLPERVINKIAAGEVVQRPSHVIKELLDNAIDAEAHTIKVHIQRGGLKTIIVEDDGIGMSEVDARLCFERHATSKIATEEDLSRITTMGFRGEALAAIAQVALVTLETRMKGESIGTRVIIKGGHFIKQEPCYCPEGTRVLVEDLFFNYPARKKAMASPKTEQAHVVETFKRVAIAQPKINFQIYVDGELLYSLTATTLPRRITQLFGDKVAKNWIRVEEIADKIKIHGYILRDARISPAWHQFVVNGRPVKDDVLHSVISSHFKNKINRTPSYIIFIDVPPEWVDVNVHPAKELVQFADLLLVKKVLDSAVKKAIAGAFDGTELNFDAPSFITSAINKLKPSRKIKTLTSFPIDEQNTEKEDNPPKQTYSNTLNALFENTIEPRILVISGKYAITQLKSGVAIIDLNNAYRRIAFDSIVRAIEEGLNIKQHQLFHKIVELPPQYRDHIDEMVDILNKSGFSVQRIGPDTVVVSAMPIFLQNVDLDYLLSKVLGALQSKAFQRNTESFAHLLAEEATYNGAGDQKAVDQLLSQLFQSSDPNRTPSGKPIIKLIEFSELEKFFRKS